MTIAEVYANHGESPEVALRRFGGSTGLFLRFLARFAQDETFVQLENAIKCRNRAETLRLAHSLKGLCSMFGFSAMQERFSAIVSACRNEEDAEMILGYFALAKAEYQTVQMHLHVFLSEKS